MAGSIEALDAELRGAGALDARGEFTIDADKARDKLRRFQLVVPQHYVLLIVQALVLRGATTIAVRVDGDDVHFSADGDPFSQSELGDLSGAIFTEARDHRRLSHHYLALGLGAAMSLDPRWLTVSSGGAELTQRNKRPDELRERPGAPLAGTTIHVRDRFHPRILLQMWSREEAEILRRRCHLGDAVITLGGAPISRGLALPSGVRCIEAIDLPAHGPHSAAIVGVDLRDPEREATAEIITAGVLIATHKLPLPRGFIAHIRADLLGKDVSQADVVRDAAYHEVITAVTAASLRTLDRLVDLISDPTSDHRYDRAHLLAWLFSQASADLPAAIAAAPERYPPARLRLWRTLGGATLSTLDLLGDRPLRVLHSPPELLLPELADIILVERVRSSVGELPVDDDDAIDAAAFLRICFGPRLVDAGAIVRRVIAREHGRRAFLSRPHPAGLESGAYRERERFHASDRIYGEVGLRLAGSLRPVLRVILDGNILEELTLPGPCAGLVVALIALAAPQEDYSGALRTGELAAAFLPAIAAIERLLARVAAALRDEEEALREQLLDYALATTQPAFIEDLLVGCGFARPLVQELLRGADLSALRPAWGLATDTPHPLLRLPLFTTSDARRLTLQELVHAAQRSPPLWWMPTTPRASDRPVLILDPRRRAFITALLGAAALVDYSPTAQALLVERQLLDRAPEPLEIGPALLQVPFTHGPIQGVIGLPIADTKRDKIRDDQASVRVFRRGRPLYQLSLPCLLPNIAAAFNDDDAPLRAGKGTPAPTPALTEAFERAVPHLIAEIAALSGRGPLSEPLRAVLLAVPPAVYSSHEHLRAHRLLVRQHGPELGDQRFAAFLGLAGDYTRGRIRDELTRLFTNKAPLDLDELRARLVRARKSATPAASALQARLVPVLAHVLDAPTLTIVGGAACSLADVIAWSGGRRSIYLLPRGEAADLDAEALADATEQGVLLLADDQVRAALAPLLGDKHLLDGEKIIAALRQRSRFHTRPQVPVVALPNHHYLAKIPLTGAITGELGLLPVAPGPKPASTLHIYYQRRRVTTLGTESLGLPLVGALEVNESELAPDLSSLAKGASGRLSALCRRQAGELRHHLAATFTARVDEEDRQLVAAWLRRALAERLTDAAAADLPRLRREPLIAAILELPLLRRADGQPATLHQSLEAYTPATPLTFITAPIAAAGDAIVAPEGDHDLEIILGALFPERRDVTEEFLRSPAARERQRVAPLLLTSAPTSALASRKLGRDDLQGLLWLAPLTPEDAERTRINLGDAGKEVAHLHLDPLICGGALHGAAVVVDSEWQAAPLDRKPLRAIRRAAIALWRELIADYRRFLDRLTLGERDLGPRFVELRDALWIQLMHLHAAAKVSALDEPLTALTAELRELPLLPLANRRLLSLDHALREQPAELLSFGLWDPPAPAPAPATSAAAEPAPAHFTSTASTAPPAESAPQPAPEPTPEERLLEAVREELRLVRDAAQGALTDAHLISLALGSGSGAQVLIEHRGLYLLDLRHPLVHAAAERQGRDPLLVSILASAAYTYLNHKLAELEDHDEAAFHAHHARHLLTTL